MPDKTDGDSSEISGLTSDQTQLLTDAIKEVKSKLYFAVLKRLKITGLLATLALTGFGVISWSGVTNAAIDETARALSADQVVRDQVVAGAVRQIQAATDEIEEAVSAARGLERETARVAATLEPSMQIIAEMITQLRSDIRLISEALPKPDEL